MEFAAFLDGQIAEHAEVLGRTGAALRAPFQKLVEACLASLAVGGKMVGLADPLLIVPSTVTARIQEMHILIGHALCDQVEAKAAPAA